VALISGVILDQIVDPSGVTAPEHVHRMLSEPLRIGLAIILLLIIGAAALPRRRGATSDDVDGRQPAYSMVIGGMTCDHCVDSIQRALTECDGVTDATVDLASGRATIFGENIEPEGLAEAVESLGYTAAGSRPVGEA
jgi:copper chaperone CopZ